MSHDPESIRLLTQRYRFLRGLEQVPIALAFLAMAAANALDLLWSPIVLVVLLALAIPASGWLSTRCAISPSRDNACCLRSSSS
jgi:hypothetical protein